MKNVILLMYLIASLTSVNAYAQAKLNDAQKTELRERFKKFRDELNLSPEQEPQVRKIDSVYLAGLASLKNSESGKMAKFRQWKSLESARDSQMKNVLTKEQFGTYQKFKTDMRNELKGMRQQGN